MANRPIIWVLKGAMRYKAQLKAIPEGGSMEVDDIDLIVKNADAVTLAIVAATNFVNYKDVSGDPECTCGIISEPDTG